MDGAISLAAELENEFGGEDRPSLGREVAVDARRPGVIAISDGDGFREPEHVIRFVLRCAEAFDLAGR